MPLLCRERSESQIPKRRVSRFLQIKREAVSLFVRWHHLPRRGYAAPRLPDVTPSLRPFGPSRRVAGEGSFPWPLTASPPSRISLVFQLTKKMMMVDEGALRVSLLSVCLVLLDVGHKTIDRDDRKTDRPTDRRGGQGAAAAAMRQR